MIIRTFRRWATGITLALSFFPLSNVQAAIPPAENLLPVDTLLVVTVPDFSALRTDLHQSPQWLFWNDPAMKPFHDKFMGNLNNSLIGPLEADLGIRLEDFEDLAQGQLTIAATRNGWNGKDENTAGIVFLLDAQDKKDLLKTTITALQKKWKDSGKTIRTQAIRGIPFSIVTISSNDVPGALTNIFHPRPQVQEIGQQPAPEKLHQLVVGQYDSLLIVGDSVESVDPIVAHLTGSEMPALSDNATFANDKMTQFHGSPLYYGWFDAKTFFGIIASMPPPEENPDAPTVMPSMDMGKIVAALGFPAMKSVSFTYSDSPEGAQVNFFIAIPGSGRQGILKMLAPLAESAAPPVFVPADATKFFRCRVDGQQAWQTLQDMLNNISPSAMIGVNAAIDMANANAQQKDPGFDIRKSLFQNLGDDFIRYEKAPGNSSAGPTGAPALYLISVQNGDRAVAAINTLMLLAPSEQKPPAPRNFQGHKIYSIPLPGVGIPGATASAPRFLYCTTSGGYVALTPDVSMLESYLRSAANPPKPLGSLPGLMDAAQHVGGMGNGLFGYQNQRELVRTVFKALNGQSLDAMSPIPLIPQVLRDSIDLSLLPDYDAVSKYFYYTVFAGSTTANGISLETFAPRPPQLN